MDESKEFAIGQKVFACPYIGKIECKLPIKISRYEHSEPEEYYLIRTYNGQPEIQSASWIHDLDEQIKQHNDRVAVLNETEKVQIDAWLSLQETQYKCVLYKNNLLK